jgi:hypothetical protein
MTCACSKAEFQTMTVPSSPQETRSQADEDEARGALHVRVRGKSGAKVGRVRVRVR